MNTGAQYRKALRLEAKHPGKRYCYHCSKLRPRSHFAGKGTKSRECTKCRADRWARMPPEGRLAQLVVVARWRAKKFKVPFNLSVDDLRVPDKCPVLGIPLKFSRYVQRYNSPSLDRIEPSKGYVRGNVLVVSWRANDLRRNFSADELLAAGRFYKRLRSK